MFNLCHFNRRFPGEPGFPLKMAIKMMCVCLIAVVDSTKIIFEMSSLANVSPQTISCCSMVHFSSDTVTWKYLINSWHQNAVDRWSLTMSRFAV